MSHYPEPYSREAVFERDAKIVRENIGWANGLCKCVSILLLFAFLLLVGKYSHDYNVRMHLTEGQEICANNSLTDEHGEESYAVP